MNVRLFRLAALLLLLFIFQSCELYTIGGRTIRLPDINQESPEGVVMLFSEELQRQNALAASRLFVTSAGKSLTAAERELLVFDVKRYIALYGSRKVTDIEAKEQENALAVEVSAVLDYFKVLRYTTQKVNGKWFIVSLEELPFE